MADGKKYQLVYFNGRGKAEVLRYMLAYSGRQFEDCRLTLTEWQQLKHQLSSDAKLPVLDIDEHQEIFNSVDIGRYLAKECDIYGLNEQEKREIDSIIGELMGLYPALNPVLRATFAKQHKRKEEAWTHYRETVLRKFLDRYAQKLSAYNATGRFLVGGRLSWADLAVAELLSRFEQFYDSFLLHDYPQLKELCTNVEKIPAIKQWTDDRPTTTF